MFNINWAANAGAELPRLIAAALAETNDVPALTAVPNYRPALAHLLVNIGFKKQTSYEVMVKPLAQTVSEMQQVFATVS